MDPATTSHAHQAESCHGEQHAPAALTIGRVAEKLDIPVSTIRYYERLGLVAPSSRSKTRYRHYDDECVRRLRFIQAAKQHGFSLNDIRELFEARQEEDQVRIVRRLILTTLKKKKERVAELDQEIKALENSYELCLCSPNTAFCCVLEALENASGA
jgi:MerR family Zn(II)-responsive transcriptional regulator of zntA